MPRKLISPKAIRKDMRKLGILTIFAGIGLFGAFPPNPEIGTEYLWAQAGLFFIGFTCWLSGATKPHNPPKKDPN